MVADVLLTHFNQIVCPNDPGHPLTGQEMKEATIIEDGYLSHHGSWFWTARC